MEEKKRQIVPRGTCRILYVSDPSSIARNLIPDPAKPEDLRQWVDMLADNKVDAFNQEVYSQGWTAYWRSDRVEYDRRAQHRRFIPMLDRGIQPLDVLIDQSHKRGMTFIAGFRINDNHSDQAKQQGVGIASFIASHPEWALTEFPEGEYYKLSEPLDFTFGEVREYVLSVIEEVASRFDIDGIEMCFRDHAYFPVNQGRQRAHLMTDFVRRIRTMLDEKGKVKGKKLLLGARVFSTLKECSDLGLDTTSWILDGLLDYISPQDIMFADFNLPYEEFCELTRKSNCMLYPGLLPWTSHRARLRLNQIPLSSANCRALAKTMYSAGADGISVYNHFCGMWNAPFYPQMLAIFRELRELKRVLSGERHYIFEPTWGGVTGFGLDRCSTGAVKANRLVLDRASTKAAGEYQFNLYEELTACDRAVLIFRGFGLTEADELEIRLNGHPVPSSLRGCVLATSSIWQTRESSAPARDGDHVRTVDGRMVKSIPEQGRIDFRLEKEPSFSTRWFVLAPSFLEYGENLLEVTLARGDPRASGNIIIDEVEAFVHPR